MWGDLLRCLQLRTPRAALLPEKEQQEEKEEEKEEDGNAACRSWTLAGGAATWRCVRRPLSRPAT